MPKTLVTIASGLCWRRTVIRRRSHGLETDLRLEVEGRSLSVAFDSLPEREFLWRLMSVQRLDILEETGEGPGGERANRYRVQILGGEPFGEAAANGRYVRWGPIE